MEKRQLYLAVKEWLEDYKSISVKALTYDRLLVSHKLMTKYPIAEMTVDEITSRQMQSYLNSLVRDGYSMSTIKKQFNLLTGYWKFAMSQGDVEKPVYLAVKLPSENVIASTPCEAEMTYTRDEQEAMRRIFRRLDKPQHAVALLMLETGMRIGEALALTWEDILWNRRAIKVNATLIRLSSKPGVTYVQNVPKSKTSRRTIPLNNEAYDIIERLYKRRSSNSKYVFSQKDDPDLPYSYSSVEFHVRRVCQDLDIPYHGLHAFRHTFATNCYERGCNVKILSKLLGHADVSITYNIYIHLYGDGLEEMRAVVG